MDNKKNLIILTVFFIAFSAIFYGKTGNILIDFSRESYIPYQINNGEYFFKDIFLIYGPFGYFLNSILYNISSNINILFLEAILISYSILIFFYLILKKFCKEKIALIFSIIFIAVSIFSNATFGFVVPYSFSTLWAVFAIYLTLVSLLYNKKNLAFLALGLILSNKIEFFIPIFVISLAYLIYKKEKFKKNILHILIFPIISYGLLFLNNFDFGSIVQNFNYILKMSNTTAISSLYKGVGSFFEIEYFKYNIILLLKIFLIATVSYLLFRKNKKISAYIILSIGLLFLNLEFALNLSSFILIFLTIYFSFKKNITPEELLVTLFAIILCSKSIFAVNSLSYSNFGFILVIFAIYMKLKDLINEKWLINTIIMFFSILFISKMIVYHYEEKTKISTEIGNIWLEKYKAELFVKTNEYIKKNIKNDEKFIVIPEGQILNLIHKKPYDFYNSTFTPLDFETFGEKKLTENLKENKTDYIILFPRDTRDYGAKIMCYDYAVDFCKYVMDNYTKIYSYDELHIFKIKK